MIKLLFVEDDEQCAYMVQGGLELLDMYDIQHATNGKEALELYNTFRPDVIVSDIDMPEMSGLELARIIRKNDNHVIFLLASGLSSPKDVRQGYQLNIDEYVKKPYIAEELHFRIQAILKRAQQKDALSAYSTEDSETKLSIGNYQFDTKQGTLSLNNKITQSLTPREAAILLLLYKNNNQLVSRNEILEQLWSEEDPVFASRSLDVFISKLRKYLSKDTSVKITNVRGKGLMLKIG